MQVIIVCKAIVTNLNAGICLSSPVKKSFIKRCILTSGLEWFIVNIKRSQVIIISELKRRSVLKKASSEDPDEKLHCFAKVLTYRLVSLTRYHLNDQRDVWLNVWIQRDGLVPSGKSQVAIGFLRNSGMDPPQEAIGPEGPIASRGRSIRPSVKYVDDSKKIYIRTTPDRFSYSKHVA